ncbi:MAG TPA: Crp/Fnr family transcriptional regulator, partial [Cyclobacteriaceae bacterium]|nr:Crp/Fnr family transcriptional regulator [Cyclobacteriaceae bacterium]
PKTVWVNLYEKHPFLQRFWLKTIEYNYIGMEERVFHQIALSAEQRYQWMLENYPRFNKEVPAKYIASMLGITPRHLSRIRAKRG